MLALLNAFRDSEDKREKLIFTGMKWLNDGILIDVDQWETQTNYHNRDMKRVKQIRPHTEPISPILGPYRIIYRILFDEDSGDQTVKVLAIVHRDEFNYENGTTGLSARILSDYDNHKG